MTTHVHDPYPSRTGADPQMIDRSEPVVRGTAADGPLSQEQLDRFERDGFLQLDAVFSPDEVNRMAAELTRMSSDPAIRAEDSTIIEPYDDEVRSIFAWQRHSPVLLGAVGDDRVAGAARQILDSDVYLHQTRVNYKPGFRGAGFDWHSDFETWHTEDGMPGMRCLSASILLTDNHTQNGPLMLMPGSQGTFVTCAGETPEDNYRESLRKQVLGVPDDKMLQRLYERGGIHVGEGLAGSMILFDCNTIHGSNSNITPDPRSNVFAVFNSVHNAIVEPFAAAQHRPEWVAHHDTTPLPHAA